MKKTDIERIIKGGSVRQKIKLYMTDIALLNTDMNSLDFTRIEGELVIKGTSLMSAKERDLLWESIKEPQDVKYYKNLCTWNASFLLFKDKLTIDVVKLTAYYMIVAGMYKEYEANEKNAEIINELLSLYPDKKTRDKALKKATEMTKGWGGKPSTPPYIEIDMANYFNEVSRIVVGINKTIESIKSYIKTFKRILSKELPLQPYRDWVKKEEDSVIEIVGHIYDITTDIEGYSSGGYPQLLTYDMIEVNITEEDLEDFKNAGG